MAASRHNLGDIPDNRTEFQACLCGDEGLRAVDLSGGRYSGRGDRQRIVKNETRTLPQASSGRTGQALDGLHARVSCMPKHQRCK